MQTIVEQVKNFFGLEFGFERFTEKAIKAINFARNETLRNGSHLVEPEHLFLGLLADSTTTSARLLQASGVKVNLETNEHSFEHSKNLKFSAESKFILELALQIVRLQRKKSIDTEHLLWGLVRLAETDNLALNKLLQKYEVDLITLNNQLAQTV
jgi:putative transcriptional regulator